MAGYERVGPFSRSAAISKLISSPSMHRSGAHDLYVNLVLPASSFILTLATNADTLIRLSLLVFRPTRK